MTHTHTLTHTHTHLILMTIMMQFLKFARIFKIKLSKLLVRIQQYW